MVCTCDEPGRPWVASLSVSVVLCEFRGEVSLFQSRCLGEDVGKRALQMCGGDDPGHCCVLSLSVELSHLSTSLSWNLSR